MLGLPDMQANVARAILERDEAAVSGLILEDGLSSQLRLDVHRNTVLASLTDVLAEVFPVVCRLVDERFFRYAASAFIRTHPPRQPCLSAYGEEFPAFLAGFPACQELVYLPDVARLEWVMRRAAFAEESPALSLAALSGIAEPQRLALELDRSLGVMSSPWPIDRIWRANQLGGDSAERIDLSSGGAHLEVRRVADEVVLRTLDIGTSLFRAALCRRSTLLHAAEAALAADPGFDLAPALADLFGEGVVIGIALKEGA
jgi:hypothetical protein